MFGPNLRIEYEGFGVNLIPLEKEWMSMVAKAMSSLDVNMYTRGLYGFTVQDEEKWFERNREDRNGVLWGILPDGSDSIVGSTSLHDIDVIGSCVSGIIIFEKAWWGKGVASRAHLIRTWYAADMLNRILIQSHARVPNVASRKALERVGYISTGVQIRSAYRKGKFLDTTNLTWLHPERISILYPEGLPNEYVDGVEGAKLALEKARDLVQIL